MKILTSLTPKPKKIHRWNLTAGFFHPHPRSCPSLSLGHALDAISPLRAELPPARPAPAGSAAATAGRPANRPPAPRRSSRGRRWWHLPLAGPPPDASCARATAEATWWLGARRVGGLGEVSLLPSNARGLNPETTNPRHQFRLNSTSPQKGNRNSKTCPASKLPT